MATDQSLIAISVGNSRTQIGQFLDGELSQSAHIANGDLPQAVQAVADWWKALPEESGGSILLASVNDPVAERLISMVEDQLSADIYRVGVDVPVPIGQQLDPETLTGVDRLLNAAAAFARVKQACVVIDAGTAVTVDFVDGEGTFQGGTISPGASMQLHSLHEHTAALPELPFSAPDEEPFGRNTSQAMLQGVYHGIRGMVQRLVERYAEHYGAFPLVIATGGDAKVLFGDDPLIDRIVPELTLLGIAATARHAMSEHEPPDGHETH